MKRSQMTPEENIADLVSKVRFYKKMFLLQRAYIKASTGLLKYLRNNNNNKISSQANQTLENYYNGLDAIHQEKLASLSKKENNNLESNDTKKAQNENR